MSKLHIGEGLLLPKDAVTSTLVVYGGKGTGKTNFGSVLAEELSQAHLRWAAADPMGVWWGLRHSQDGKGPGIECLILGGPHGDIPIEPTGGAVVADLVADEDVNVIIDFSRKPNGEAWGVGEKIRFMTDYGKRLFQRQSSLLNGQRREPLMQIIDEAARFIPQMVRAGQPDMAMCLSVWAQIVEEGRNFGLGVAMLTQRSARLNKDVAELADAMLAFRTVGPNSIAAVMDWLGEHVPKARVHEIIEKVRELPRGTCLVVSPGWLQMEAIAAVRARRTYDSSYTPKPGEQRQRVRGEAARPDLAKYAERMQATIARAKAEDPKELQRKVRELEKELAKPKPTMAAPKETWTATSALNAKIRRLQAGLEEAMKVLTHVSLKGFEEANLDPAEIQKAVERATAEIAKLAERTLTARQHEFSKLKTQCAQVLSTMKSLLEQQDVTVDLTVKKLESYEIETVKPPPRLRRVPQVEGNGTLKGPERKILTALGELLSIGKESSPKEMVAAWAIYSPKGSAFTNPLGALRSQGLVHYPQPGMVALTDAGRALVGACDPPDQREIWRRIEAVCTGPELKILRTLAECAGRGSMSKEQLAEQANYSHKGSAYTNPLGALRSKGMLYYPQPGQVQAAEWLFRE